MKFLEELAYETQQEYVDAMGCSQADAAIDLSVTYLHTLLELDAETAQKLMALILLKMQFKIDPEKYAAEFSMCRAKLKLMSDFEDGLLPIH